MSKIIPFLIIVIVLLFTSYGQTSELSEKEYFYRCYSHLTGKRPSLSSDLLKDVQLGSITAVKACEFILDSATLNPQGHLKINNAETKAVLNNFTKVHSGFFKNRYLYDTGNLNIRNSVDIFDELAPALAYTKSLFDRAFNVTQILTYNTEFEGVRDEGPRGFLFKFKDSKKNKSVGFSQVGDLIGVIDNTRARNEEIPGSNKNLFDSSGGGILGSRTYMKKNSIKVEMNSDGATKMNRVIAKAVIEDFLCKNLPATRLADGQVYVNDRADAVFRRSTGCIHCHTTMDMMAAGFRDIRNKKLPFEHEKDRYNEYRPLYQFKRPPDKPDGDLWPVSADNDYAKRPPKGVLYFRSYTGRLIRENFNNLNQLANKILETNDYYACIVKKYYKYFTGINVSLADINDPFSTVKLNDQDLYHRNQVIKYGQELKKHKSPNALIKSILNSEVYKTEGYTPKQEVR